MRPSELEQVTRTRAALTSGAARRGRIAAGVSIAEAARVVGLSRQALWAWEEQKSAPTDKHALAYGRLLAALGVALMVVLSACTSSTGTAVPVVSPVTATGGAGVSPVLSSPLASAPPLVKVHDPKQITGSLAGMHCQFRGTEPDILPDAACTPGAYDPLITAKVLCAPGYTTRSYRPPVYRSARFELEQALPAYGLANVPGSASELDHLVPLTLGGANDATNLWPELGKVPNAKDRVEVKLHAWVCAPLTADGPDTTRAAREAQAQGRLEGAQQAIAADWVTALDALNV